MLRREELYKKYYAAMEHAEKVLTGSDQDDWVLEKAEGRPPKAPTAPLRHLKGCLIMSD